MGFSDIVRLCHQQLENPPSAAAINRNTNSLINLFKSKIRSLMVSVGQREVDQEDPQEDAGMDDQVDDSGDDARNGFGVQDDEDDEDDEDDDDDVEDDEDYYGERQYPAADGSQTNQREGDDAEGDDVGNVLDDFDREFNINTVEFSEDFHRRYVFMFESRVFVVCML